MKTLTFRITGIHCGGCAAVSGTSCGGCRENVERVLKEFPGIIHSHVLIPARRATLTYDPAVFAEDALVKAVRNVGFEIDRWDQD